MYKRILVAIDGSTTSLRGLNEAVRVAKATGGTLLLVHVVNGLGTRMGPEFVPSAVYREALLAWLREAGTQVLQQASAIVGRAEVASEQRLLETLGGRAADDIVMAARQWPADLIVLGTHGRRGLKRLAMGSDAELVLRMSPVPVLLVRDQPEVMNTSLVRHNP